MSSSEEKFKQSLRSLVDSKEFPFEEEDWDKAAAYISKRRGSKHLRRLGIAAIVAVSLGVVFLLSSDDPAAVAEKQMAGKQVQANAPAAETPAAANKRESETPVGGATDNRPAGNVPSPFAEKQSRSLISSRAEAALPETVTNSGKANVSIKKVNKTADPNVAPEIPAETTSIEEPSAVVPHNENVTVKPTIPVAAVELEATITPTPEKDPVKTPEQVTESPAANDSSVIMEETPAVVTAAITPNEVPSKVPDSLLAKVPQRPLLSIEAGPAYHAGWSENGAREGDGFNMVAGANALSQVNEKFDLSFGVQYQRSGQLGNFQHVSKSSRLSFGEESEVQVVTPRKLHYVAAPIRLYYRHDEKNTFGAGYVIAYLLDVESDVETYTLKAGKETNHKSFSTRGYTDGFKLFDSQITLFYRRTLNKKLDVHGELFFGLGDVKQDNFFGTTGAQRNSGLRVMLCYKLLNRTK